MFRNLNMKVIDMLSKQPELFYDNIQIAATFDHIPGQIWGGGRGVSHAKGKFPPLAEIKNIIEGYNSVGVGVRFTYTNLLIQPEHLEDDYCNRITEIAHNGMNGIIVASPIMETYLRMVYPNYKYIFSTTRRVKDPNVLNQLTKKYDMVVPDFGINNQWAELEKLHDPGSIELLVDHFCDLDYPCGTLHYQFSSCQTICQGDMDKMVEMLPWIQDPEKMVWRKCNKRTFYWEEKAYPAYINADDMYTWYVSHGFHNFKMTGRMQNPAMAVEGYVQHMVKPEHHNRVRNILLGYSI